MQHISICKGPRCMNHGANSLNDAVAATTGATVGNPSAQHTVHDTSCLDHCSTAPNVAVDGVVHENAQPADVPRLVRYIDPDERKDRTGLANSAEDIMTANNFLGDL